MLFAASLQQTGNDSERPQKLKTGEQITLPNGKILKIIAAVKDRALITVKGRDLPYEITGKTEIGSAEHVLIRFSDLPDILGCIDKDADGDFAYTNDPKAPSKAFAEDAASAATRIAAENAAKPFPVPANAIELEQGFQRLEAGQVVQFKNNKGETRLQVRQDGKANYIATVINGKGDKKDYTLRASQPEKPTSDESSFYEYLKGYGVQATWRNRDFLLIFSAHSKSAFLFDALEEKPSSQQAAPLLKQKATTPRNPDGEKLEVGTIIRFPAAKRENGDGSNTAEQAELEVINIREGSKGSIVLRNNSTVLKNNKRTTEKYVIGHDDGAKTVGGLGSGADIVIANVRGLRGLVKWDEASGKFFFIEAPDVAVKAEIIKDSAAGSVSPTAPSAHVDEGEREMPITHGPLKVGQTIVLSGLVKMYDGSPPERPRLKIIDIQDGENAPMIVKDNFGSTYEITDYKSVGRITEDSETDAGIVFGSDSLSKLDGSFQKRGSSFYYVEGDRARYHAQLVNEGEEPGPEASFEKPVAAADRSENNPLKNGTRIIAPGKIRLPDGRTLEVNKLDDDYYRALVTHKDKDGKEVTKTYDLPIADTAKLDPRETAFRSLLLRFGLNASWNKKGFSFYSPIDQHILWLVRNGQQVSSENMSSKTVNSFSENNEKAVPHAHELHPSSASSSDVIVRSHPAKISASGLAPERPVQLGSSPFRIAPFHEKGGTRYRVERRIGSAGKYSHLLNKAQADEARTVLKERHIAFVAGTENHGTTFVISLQDMQDFELRSENFLQPAASSASSKTAPAEPPLDKAYEGTLVGLGGKDSRFKLQLQKDDATENLQWFIVDTLYKGKFVDGHVVYNRTTWRSAAGATEVLNDEINKFEIEASGRQLIPNEVGELRFEMNAENAKALEPWRITAKDTQDDVQAYWDEPPPEKENSASSVSGNPKRDAALQRKAVSPPYAQTTYIYANDIEFSDGWRLNVHRHKNGSLNSREYYDVRIAEPRKKVAKNYLVSPDDLRNRTSKNWQYRKVQDFLSQRNLELVLPEGTTLASLIAIGEPKTQSGKKDNNLIARFSREHQRVTAQASQSLQTAPAQLSQLVQDANSEDLMKDNITINIERRGRQFLLKTPGSNDGSGILLKKGQLDAVKKALTEKNISYKETTTKDGSLSLQIKFTLFQKTAMIAELHKIHPWLSGLAPIAATAARLALFRAQVDVQTLQTQLIHAELTAAQAQGARSENSELDAFIRSARADLEEKLRIRETVLLNEKSSEDALKYAQKNIRENQSRIRNTDLWNTLPDGQKQKPSFEYNGPSSYWLGHANSDQRKKSASTIQPAVLIQALKYLMNNFSVRAQMLPSATEKEGRAIYHYLEMIWLDAERMIIEWSQANPQDTEKPLKSVQQIFQIEAEMDATLMRLRKDYPFLKQISRPDQALPLIQARREMRARNPALENYNVLGDRTARVTSHRSRGGRKLVPVSKAPAATEQQQLSDLRLQLSKIISAQRNSDFLTDFDGQAQQLIKLTGLKKEYPALIARLEGLTSRASVKAAIRLSQALLAGASGLPGLKLSTPKSINTAAAAARQRFAGLESQEILEKMTEEAAANNFNLLRDEVKHASEGSPPSFASLPLPKQAQAAIATHERNFIVTIDNFHDEKFGFLPDEEEAGNGKVGTQRSIKNSVAPVVQTSFITLDSNNAQLLHTEMSGVADELDRWVQDRSVSLSAAERERVWDAVDLLRRLNNGNTFPQPLSGAALGSHPDAQERQAYIKALLGDALRAPYAIVKQADPKGMSGRNVQITSSGITRSYSTLISSDPPPLSDEQISLVQEAAFQTHPPSEQQPVKREMISPPAPVDAQASVATGQPRGEMRVPLARPELSVPTIESKPAINLRELSNPVPVIETRLWDEASILRAASMPDVWKLQDAEGNIYYLKRVSRAELWETRKWQAFRAQLSKDSPVNIAEVVYETDQGLPAELPENVKLAIDNSPASKYFTREGTSCYIITRGVPNALPLSDYVRSSHSNYEKLTRPITLQELESLERTVADMEKAKLDTTDVEPYLYIDEESDAYKFAFYDFQPSDETGMFLNLSKRLQEYKEKLLASGKLLTTDNQSIQDAEAIITSLPEKGHLVASPRKRKKGKPALESAGSPTSAKRIKEKSLQRPLRVGDAISPAGKNSNEIFIVEKINTNGITFNVVDDQDFHLIENIKPGEEVEYTSIKSEEKKTFSFVTAGGGFVVKSSDARLEIEASPHHQTEQDEVGIENASDAGIEGAEQTALPAAQNEDAVTAQDVMRASGREPAMLNRKSVKPTASSAPPQSVSQTPVTDNDILKDAGANSFIQLRTPVKSLTMADIARLPDHSPVSLGTITRFSQITEPVVGQIFDLKTIDAHSKFVVTKFKIVSVDEHSLVVRMLGTVMPRNLPFQFGAAAQSLENVSTRQQMIETGAYLSMIERSGAVETGQPRPVRGLLGPAPASATSLIIAPQPELNAEHYINSLGYIDTVETIDPLTGKTTNEPILESPQGRGITTTTLERAPSSNGGGNGTSSTALETTSGFEPASTNAAATSPRRASGSLSAAVGYSLLAGAKATGNDILKWNADIANKGLLTKGMLWDPASAMLRTPEELTTLRGIIPLGGAATEEATSTIGRTLQVLRASPLVQGINVVGGTVTTALLTKATINDVHDLTAGTAVSRFNERTAPGGSFADSSDHDYRVKNLITDGSAAGATGTSTALQIINLMKTRAALGSNPLGVATMSATIGMKFLRSWAGDTVSQGDLQVDLFVATLQNQPYAIRHEIAAKLLDRMLARSGWRRGSQSYENIVTNLLKYFHPADFAYATRNNIFLAELAKTQPNLSVFDMSPTERKERLEAYRDLLKDYNIPLKENIQAIDLLAMDGSFNISGEDQLVPSGKIMSRYTVDEFSDRFMERADKIIDTEYEKLSPLQFIAAQGRRTAQVQYASCLTEADRNIFMNKANLLRSRAAEQAKVSVRRYIGGWYEKLGAGLITLAMYHDKLMGALDIAGPRVKIQYSDFKTMSLAWLEFVLKQQAEDGYTDEFKEKAIDLYTKHKQRYSQSEKEFMDNAQKSLNETWFTLPDGKKIFFGELMMEPEYLKVAQ